MPDTEAAEPMVPKPAPKRKPAAKKPEASSAKTAATAKKAEASSIKEAPVARKAVAAKATAASKNGHAKAAIKETPPAAEPATPLDRAEDTLDELGKVVGGFLANAAQRLRKAAAVGREELEDLWAEAQSIRRGDIS